MLSSIHPLGERARGNTYRVTVAAFVVAGAVGGALTGLVSGTVAMACGLVSGSAGTVFGRAIGLLGPIVGLDRSLGLTSGALVAAVQGLGLRLGPAVLGLVAAGLFVVEWSGRRLPSLRRQVDEDWIGHYRGWVYGAGFGVQLGSGVATYITAAEVLVWLAAMILVGSVPAAVGLGALFGLVRGLTILAAARIDSPQQLVGFHRRLAQLAAVRRRAGLIGLMVLAGLAATGMVAEGQLLAAGG